MNGPNPIGVAWSILRARRVRRPAPSPSGPTVDHRPLVSVLQAIETGGVAALSDHTDTLRRHLDDLREIDPDDLDRPTALAYWLNLYNLGALDLARRSMESGATTVLRTPGGFSEPVAEIAGERLSLNDIEHGKIRRFGDPRIHGALVCGSVSCPTLRHEPYEGDRLDDQLDHQMSAFLSAGAAVVSERTVELSRVFLWYGADFVRPARMPTFLPARRRAVARSLRPWLDPESAEAVDRLRVRFQAYDWGLACSVNR